MKLKEFLEPDWRKILIFVILIGIVTLINEIILPPCFMVYIAIIGARPPGYCSILSPLNRILFPLHSNFLFGRDCINNGWIYCLSNLDSYKHIWETVHGEYPGFYLIHYLLLIMTFVYWYLLSCLIVWIYDKVKKK